jgi:hypothetical protein
LEPPPQYVAPVLDPKADLHGLLLSEDGDPVHDVIERQLRVQPVRPVLQAFHDHVQIPEFFAFACKRDEKQGPML